MIERWWEGQYLQKVTGKLTKRGKERDKQEIGPKKRKKSQHGFCLLCCCTFDLSAWKTEEEEEKYRRSNSPNGTVDSSPIPFTGLLNHSYSTSSLLKITA